MQTPTRMQQQIGCRIDRVLGTARLTKRLELRMCTHHTTQFCGTCGACQREQLARWQRQLVDATTLARTAYNAPFSASTSHRYYAIAAPSRPR
jgi:hypothetical protein